MIRKLLSLMAVLLTTTAMSGERYVQDFLVYELHISDEGTSYAEVVGHSEFGSAYDLTIPSSITYDGVEYPITEIGEGSLAGWHELTSVKIGDYVKIIGESAFQYCRELVNIEFGNALTTICEDAFYSCEKLESVILGPSVITIEDNAFDDCYGITTIKLGSSVNKVGKGAFKNCSSLIDLDLGTSVRLLGKESFQNCVKLTHLVLPSSLTYIADEVFLECKDLQEIVYDTDNPIDGVREIFSDEAYDNAVVYIGTGGFDKAKTISPWKFFANIQALPEANVEDILSDFNSEVAVEVYNMNGFKIADSINSLPQGLYIVRQGNKIRKIFVK